MIDLKQRFDELRDEERRHVPRFAIREPRRGAGYRWAFAMLLLIVIVATILPHRATTFSAADRAVARSISTWHAPTDVLLKGVIR